MLDEEDSILLHKRKGNLLKEKKSFSVNKNRVAERCCFICLFTKMNSISENPISKALLLDNV